MNAERRSDVSDVDFEETRNPQPRGIVMSRVTLLFGLSLLVALSALACNGDEILNPTSTTDVLDSSTEDLTETPDAVADTGPPLETRFSECEQSTECDDNNECLEDVCVKEPLQEPGLFEEADDEYVDVEGSPNFECWVEPIAIDQTEPSSVTFHGDVEPFGPALPTRNLCISFYDGQLFIPWINWLENNVCGELLDLDPRDQAPYVNCFGLDPCRCEDAEFTVDRGDASVSVNACYAEIGFCDGIVDDEELLATCQANILERTGSNATSFIYGTTQTEAFPDDPDREEGVYEMANLPANTLLVVKISGNIERWRDTYEFGVIGLSSMADGNNQIDKTLRAITDGAWQTIPTTAGIPYSVPPERGAVAGRVYDCGETGRDPARVMGARVGLVEDPAQIAYFNAYPEDLLPLPGRADTNRDGVYAAIDLPSGPNRVSVAVTVDQELMSGGARNVWIVPFSVSLSDFHGNYDVSE